MDGKILIVDDNEDVLFALNLLLEPYVEKIKVTTSPARIEYFMDNFNPDIILLDMNFSRDASSGQEGFLWLEKILQKDPQAVVLFITAYADTEKAVKAIRAGAIDFIPKPWETEKLLATISSAIRLRQTRTEVVALKEQLTALSAPDEGVEIIGESPAILEVIHTIKKISGTDANILLLGENGTGKDLIARAIYQNSPRNGAPFVPIDLGAIPETLFESELFGHVKGSFTDAHADRTGKFEAANHSSLFLDEIGNLPYHLQAKLLTAIQQRSIVRVGSNEPVPVDIRLICATNRNLQGMVDKGEFREDLLYRINTIHVEIPPLRNRREDIVPLAERFITRFCKQYDKAPISLTASACEKLTAHSWYGNIRELEHAIEKAVIICDGNSIPAEMFQLVQKTEIQQTEASTLEEMEKAMIRKALDKCEGNLSAVASQLGITRQTLYNKMKKFSL